MTTNPNDEFGMFTPTTDEEAAKQSNTNRGVDILVDILKPDVLHHEFEEGDNWMRFISTYGDPWNEIVPYYDLRVGNKVARVADQQKLFGDINLLTEVQIGLYGNPETKPYMYRKVGDKAEGFRFNDRRRAYFLASRWENSLSPFGVVHVTLGRQYKNQQTYKEAWGDQLLKIPAEMEIDPMLPSSQKSKPKPRWGAIFDPFKGRLIKCSFTNWGTKEVTASFTPNGAAMPLGEWFGPDGSKLPVHDHDDPEGNFRKGDLVGQLPKGAKFKPFPQYLEVLRSVPRLKDCFRRLTIEEQVELVRTFVPSHLLPTAEKIMDAKLSDRRGSKPVSMAGAASSAAAPAPAAATASAPAAAAPAPAPKTPQVQLAVPEEEPTRLDETDKLYLDFVKELGPNFSLVGEPVARKLIKLSLINSGNIKQMASFQPEMLKTLAQAT
jgi:hypothetical protein